MEESIAEHVQTAGFAHVAIDPQGYRQGSLNAALKKQAAAES